MALRSIEITLPEGKKEQIEELLSERKEALDVRMQHIIGSWGSRIYRLLNSVA